jgi:hypothetical protein
MGAPCVLASHSPITPRQRVVIPLEALRLHDRSADSGNVTGSMILPYFVLWATLMKALLVKANIVPPSCARCGRTFERRDLGEPVCRCAGH